MKIGMVGTRFAGLDGVTLESAKVAAIMERLGHEVCWFAGELGEEFSPGVLVPEAHFSDVDELRRQRAYFGSDDVPPRLVDEVRSAAAYLADQLRQFVFDVDVDVLMPQNALAIPMQVPLAMAISDVIGEGTPALAHHHDFAWEKPRFTVTSVGHLLDAYFPPRHPAVVHLVISSLARDQLARRTGIGAAVLPNVMDFAGSPAPADPDAFRRAAGIGSGMSLLLQPTRVIPRKGIETSLDLAARLGPDCVVVVTHPEGDEGMGYGKALQRHAAAVDVDLRFVAADGVGGAPTLADAYAAADLVVYPSTSEGFGNAFVEAIYHRRPVLVRRYEVYAADIAPHGFECIEIGGYLTDEAVLEASRCIREPERWRGGIERNYEKGLAWFSYEAAEAILERELGKVERRIESRG